MPLIEFRQWAVFYEVENETPTTTENILAHIAAIVTSYLCKKRYKASDFLPKVISEKVRFTKKQGSDFFKGLKNLVTKG